MPVGFPQNSTESQLCSSVSVYSVALAEVHSIRRSR